jgi:hypothetical protein
MESDNIIAGRFEKFAGRFVGWAQVLMHTGQLETQPVVKLRMEFGRPNKAQLELPKPAPRADGRPKLHAKQS